MMKVTVFIPNSRRLGNIGFTSVMYTPVLFDSKNRYIREVNRYLRERSQGSQENDSIKRNGNSTKGASPIYIKNIAYMLRNFIEWCEYKKKHWKSVTYDDVIEYQNSQLSALRPHGKRSLSAATANQRADEATHFLQWASLCQLRPAFTYAKVQINRRFSSSSGRGTAVTWVRAERAKEDQNKEIHILDGLPNAADLKHWLQKVRSELGQSLYLACRVIVEAGLRKMEVCSLLTTQFPPKPDIVWAMESGRSFVQVHLTVTKGGKPRTVEIPCLLALEISEYVNGRRMIQAFRYKKLSVVR